jgi:hypothetical protein
MAVVKRNSIIDAIRGHMGNVVFRVRNGIQEMYGMPKKSEKAPSPAQIAQRLLMKLANQWAKQLKTNPAMRAFYETMAVEKHFTNAYHAAISHYLTNPNIREVDFSDYLTQAGDTIRFKPTAWLEVKSVNVILKDARGEVLENGSAQKDTRGWWTYIVQESHADSPAALVVFEICDDLDHMKARELAIPA